MPAATVSSVLRGCTFNWSWNCDLKNPNNNKAIYAKVLDKVSGIRQNDGYDLRMSNAAAIALDIADTDKFFVRVIY